MGCAASEVPNSLDNHSHSDTKATVIPSSPSNLLNQRFDSNRIVPKPDNRTDTNEIIQNFRLIWLDKNIDELSDDYINSIKQLRRTINTIEIFHDTNECMGYLSQIQNEKLFLVVSGALCKSFVPRIHDKIQLNAIYIFCRQQEKYEEWAKDWPKVKAIFTEITSLCDMVRQSARQCDQNDIEIKGVSSLNQIEPAFMYTQLLKEIILEIDFDEQKEISNLVEYARKEKEYVNSKEQLKLIDEFAADYHKSVDKNKAIRWYSQQCFTYQLVKKALRSLEVHTLLIMGFFIRDVHRNIEKLHLEQSELIHPSDTTTITVFRGQTMNKADFEGNIKQDGLISFNNFLSTSEDRRVAISFTSDLNKIGVLFEMTINRSVSRTRFARISEVSWYPNEKEVLFATHSVFRVQQIEEIQANGTTIWQVKLTLTSDSDDEQLNILTKRMRTEITGTGWERMGSLLWKLGENDKAEQVYTMLLERTSNESDQADYYHALGLMKENLGQYNQAIEFYERARDISEKTLPPNHPDLANSYNNIGNVYSDMGEYSKALSSHERALEIRNIALPPNHPDVANSYNNIASLYNSMGEYSKALVFLERTLGIFEKSLAPNHPQIALVKRNMEKVKKKI
ncbi:unnamed protein product [Rotaria socialis]|uniref:NAD(P)(+)--arginine ADP-ribosyltransferase n=1 Tax=Rotaria socialis TaxID=392032 RepID=A0A817LNP8_9BILA|nr:unnamed protein product [Rotaria socialis]CAF3328926.1 unnamed protein product [Rotaria socialis]CAF4308454.1 unnamed protein product [Rotaria socialis]CAF4479379.1 unnamed protein product [Rotaria socialis]